MALFILLAARLLSTFPLLAARVATSSHPGLRMGFFWGTPRKVIATWSMFWGLLGLFAPLVMLFSMTVSFLGWRGLLLPPPLPHWPLARLGGSGLIRAPVSAMARAGTIHCLLWVGPRAGRLRRAASPLCLLLGLSRGRRSLGGRPRRSALRASRLRLSLIPGGRLFSVAVSCASFLRALWVLALARCLFLPAPRARLRLCLRPGRLRLLPLLLCLRVAVAAFGRSGIDRRAAAMRAAAGVAPVWTTRRSSGMMTLL